MTNCTINPENGLFFPAVMMGQRDVNIFPVYGEYKFAGAIDGPVFPTNGIPLLVAGIGGDGGRLAINPLSTAGGGQGVTGTSNAVRTGTIGVVASTGATTVAYTTSTGGTPVIGDIFQFDVNNTGTPTTAEVRKVTNVTGTANPFTLTLDQPLNFTHLAATAAITVTVPYTHSIIQQNLLDSLTIEKQLGLFQSEQYAGARIAKYGFKLAAGNTEATFSADVVAQSQAILTSPNAISVVNESPFVFAEATATLYGTARLEMSSITMDIENGLAEKYTLAGQHNPQFISPVTRKISGQMIFVFSSLNDATYGYYNHMWNQSTGTEIPGSLSLALVHPGAPTPGSVTLTLSKCALKKYVDDIKMNDVILVTLDYDAYLNLSVAPVTTISSTIVDGVYLPY